jgi:prepilin-type processing-associated H-X9-DG protein
MSGTNATLRNTGVPPTSGGWGGWGGWGGGRPNVVNESLEQVIRREAIERGYQLPKLEGETQFDFDLGMGPGVEFDFERAPAEPPEDDNGQKPRESLPAPKPPAAPGPLLPVGGFGSYHPGGANFALGDGSVRFITQTIAPQVFQQLGHRADGKLLDKSSF